SWQLEPSALRNGPFAQVGHGPSAIVLGYSFYLARQGIPGCNKLPSIDFLNSLYLLHSQWWLVLAFNLIYSEMLL
ncbi:hypothetical protein QYM36_010395, partial [Artemia franciscana]